jgi:hypothetical protein
MPLLLLLLFLPLSLLPSLKNTQDKSIYPLSLSLFSYETPSNPPPSPPVSLKRKHIRKHIEGRKYIEGREVE